MMDEAELLRVVSQLRRAREIEWPRLLNIRAYLLDQVDDIYVPKEATKEYRMLVDQSRFNLMPLVVTTLAQNLYVDGYRATGTNGRPEGGNSPSWDSVWQPNRLDARQAALHRGAIKYGTSYATVLPGDRAPVVTPWSPLWLTALYEDPINDEWPRYAMTVSDPMALQGRPLDHQISEVLGGPTVRVYDETHVYDVEVDTRGNTIRAGAIGEHGLGVTPVVRYRGKIDDDGISLGEVEPLLPAQRQLNQTTFSLLMTTQYQAFRQRWATGMAIELDDDGNPLEPWNSSVQAVWQNESPDGRFGDFAETNLSGYLDSRDRSILFMSAVAQIPPHNMLAGNGISNISAEALAALESAHRRNVTEHQTAFGESHEQLLRLGALAMGDPAGWEDTSAQVVWRDTTPRSLAQIADALGKLATLLGIPEEALWERIPGVTDQDIERWRALKERDAAADDLQQLLDSDDPAGSASSPDDDVKAKADAMGVLIRSGVDAESAARAVGLDGVEFTGAVPVSLRLPETEASELEQA